MKNRTLGNYQVLDTLGSGGMGEVYKARDTRLNRLVAIKVLRTDLAPGGHHAQRFIQEAKSASALNHPNIVSIYDVFQHEGADCLVMEYIPGETLQALIPPQGHGMEAGCCASRSRWPKVCARHIRQASSHRDIKPSNIMVAADGPVKILDFGLAKISDSEVLTGDGTTLTQDGVVVGTFSYMSP